MNRKITERRLNDDVFLQSSLYMSTCNEKYQVYSELHQRVIYSCVVVWML